MTKIRLWAICVAFIAELVADLIISSITLAVLADGTLSADLDQEALRKATEAVIDSSGFLMSRVILGTATTIGGGYLAARLAKTYPYYNGLGIGLIGLIFGILQWGDPLWLNFFAIVMTIPASIYGAHLAKKHMMSPQSPAKNDDTGPRSPD
ncbi:MAG: hypothetical protein WDO72_09965 [Pseudomonadota bacterium]